MAKEAGAPTESHSSFPGPDAPSTASGRGRAAVTWLKLNASDALEVPSSRWTAGLPCEAPDCPALELWCTPVLRRLGPARGLARLRPADSRALVAGAVTCRRRESMRRAQLAAALMFLSAARSLSISA